MEGKAQIKNEVLRYLGYRGQIIDNNIANMIDEIIGEIRLLIKERYIYKIFNILDYENEIYLEEKKLHLPGRDIKKHLNRSSSCILMAATLGNAIDTRIRYYEKVDMTKALILDAAATTFIENLCDRICEEIESNVLEDKKKLTNRYSPGYGDLPIDVQNEFLSTIDAQRSIGLTASSNSILLPRKSVTAILGIVDKDEIKEKKRCIDCNKYGKCKFSIGGNSCGY